MHIDAFTVPRFLRTGHRIHGDRTRRTRGLGSAVVIGVIDDHSRLAYGELHSAENADAVAITLTRAIAWMRHTPADRVSAPLECQSESSRTRR